MNTSPSLRPMLPVDGPRLAEIFRMAVTDLTVDDYDEAQREAWAARAEDVPAFTARLGGMLTLIATVAGASVGFVALKGTDRVEMLYLHPLAVGHGVGSLLLHAIEKLAAARGAAKLTLDSSDTAQDFFTKRGYRPERRNSISVGAEWLANTTMTKTLAGDKT